MRKGRTIPTVRLALNAPIGKTEIGTPTFSDKNKEGPNQAMPPAQHFVNAKGDAKSLFKVPGG